MIARDEENIITRAFESMKNIITSYYICDTGSTDNTIQIIREYFQSKNIPGKVVEEPFKNFSHNRTYALHACIGMSDFVLLLDADMIFEIRQFNKNDLNKLEPVITLSGTAIRNFINTKMKMIIYFPH